MRVRTLRETSTDLIYNSWCTISRSESCHCLSLHNVFMSLYLNLHSIGAMSSLSKDLLTN